MTAATCTTTSLTVPGFPQAFGASVCPDNYQIDANDLPAGTVLPDNTQAPSNMCPQAGVYTSDQATEPRPRCRLLGGSTRTMCPGAQVKSLVDQYNASPNRNPAVPYMGTGICVNTQAYYTAVTDEGCTAPTQCVFMAQDKNGTKPTTTPPTDFPGYSCARIGSSATCMDDKFVCDMDLGLCRHASQDVKNKGFTGPYYDCISKCPAKKFTCNSDTNECDEDTTGKSPMDYVQCTTGAGMKTPPACSSPTGATFACDAQQGCIQDHTGQGLFKTLTDCKNACTNRCVIGTCMMSPDTTQMPCSPDCGAPSGGTGTASGGPNGTVVLIIIIVAVVLCVLGILIVWRRHKKNKASDSGTNGGLAASPPVTPAVTPPPPPSVQSVQQSMRWYR